MSKLDDLVAKYAKELTKKCGETKVDMPLLRAVAKACGPSIYKPDAATVSTSDPKELRTVRKNFLVKKLGLKDTDKLDDAVMEIGAKFGKGNRNKYRAIFYMFVAKELRKASMFTKK